MAEGWTRHLKGVRIEPYSAGVAPKGIDPHAIKVMAEAGVDISGQTSKSLDSLGDREFDYVITLCDNAREACPFFPAKTRVLHAGFEDPPMLAKSAPSKQAALVHYRRVRDEIRAFVEKLPDALKGAENDR